MKKYLIITLALLALAAAYAGAKNWAKDLDNKSEETRTRAARELMGKALEEGLTGEEIEALAEAVDDPSAAVQGFAIKALASNTKIATSQEYAPYFANRGNNFVAFLLWFSVYNTYAEVKNMTGGGVGGDIAEEIEDADKEAKRAFANMLDPARKDWAEPYYQQLAP
jgi:hypothetical protein